MSATTWDTFYTLLIFLAILSAHVRFCSQLQLLHYDDKPMNAITDAQQKKSTQNIVIIEYCLYEVHARYHWIVKFSTMQDQSTQGAQPFYQTWQIAASLVNNYLLISYDKVCRCELKPTRNIMPYLGTTSSISHKWAGGWKQLESSDQWPNRCWSVRDLWFPRYYTIHV